VSLAIQTGAGLEKGATQVLPQAFTTVDLLRDKVNANQYDLVIEPSPPEVKLSTSCNWLPWNRANQQAKVMLHVVATSRTGEVLLDNSYASEPHTRESLGDAIGDAYAEVLQMLVRQLATSPKIRAYARTIPSRRDDVTLTSLPANGKDPLEAEIAGLGFSAGFGYIITSYHVVAGLPQVRVLQQGQVAPATVALRDRVNDLALLRLHVDGRANAGQQTGLTGLRLGDASRVRSGDRVWTVTVGRDGDKPDVTEGSVSSVTGPGGDRRFFLVALPIAPGNGGGPLLNEHGEVIGVAVPLADAPEGFSVPTDQPRNTSIAVKISFAKHLLGLLPESEFLAPNSDPLPIQSSSALAEMLRPQIVKIAGSQ
jgi:S1-C subfamily serine protease